MCKTGRKIDCILGRGSRKPARCMHAHQRMHVRHKCRPHSTTVHSIHVTGSTCGKVPGWRRSMGVEEGSGSGSPAAAYRSSGSAQARPQASQPAQRSPLSPLVCP